MKRFSAFMLGLALLSFAYAEEAEPKMATIEIGNVRVDYFEEFAIHPISDLDWTKRTEYGVPDDAVRCGGFFFVTAALPVAVSIRIGMLVEKDGLLLSLLADRAIWIDGPIRARLLRGVAMVGSQFFFPGDNLIAPRALRSAFLECFHAREQEEEEESHRRTA
jgi:hypothetical protein